MKTFIQNHPGERDAKPKGNPDHNNQGVLYAAILLLCIPLAIAIPVLKRLSAIGKIQGWMMYGTIAVLALLTIAIVISVAKKMMFKNIAEQKKYYRLAGGLTWLPQEKREALQLDAHDNYHYGEWAETLEYWPCEVRLPGKINFKTFTITTRQERLASNDESWRVLSEKSYNETVDRLFNGMHSRLFAADNRLMIEEDKQKMVGRLAELTQLPESYVRACWHSDGDKPPLLLWGFDLRRIIWLSRTSFMSGLISEETAWKNILKTSGYVHALFNDMDDFFNNFRLGNAYWSNDFKITNERSQMHKAYNEDCNWPVKDIPWCQRDRNILPPVILDGCKDYVNEEIKRNTRNTIGFQPGNKDAD